LKAFPQSAICLAAICHVLKTAQMYQKHSADLAALFESISYVLDHLAIHSKSQPAGVANEEGLARILRKLLACFVEICMVAVEQSKNQKRNRVKVAVKLFLSGGEKTEFTDLLQEITDLSEKEMKFSIADMLHLVERGKEDDKRKEKSSFEASWRKSVKGALYVNEQDLYWKTSCDTYLQDRTKGTGQWLLDDGVFTKWSSADDTDFNILALEAPDSHGKTYLSAKVIDEMRAKYRTVTGTTFQHVAYFFCDGNRKNAIANVSVHTVISSWLWQLTENNPSFVKSVAGVCDKKALSQDPVTLWSDTFKQYIQQQVFASSHLPNY
jgi:hypothetical protein